MVIVRSKKYDVLNKLYVHFHQTCLVSSYPFPLSFLISRFTFRSCLLHQSYNTPFYWSALFLKLYFQTLFRTNIIFFINVKIKICRCLFISSGSAAQCVMCSEQKQPSIKNIMFPAGIWTGPTVLGYITNSSYCLFLAERSIPCFSWKGSVSGLIVSFQVY